MTQGHGTLVPMSLCAQRRAVPPKFTVNNLHPSCQRPHCICHWGHASVCDGRIWQCGRKTIFPATGDRSSVVLCRCAGTRAASLAGMISEEVSTYINTWLDVSRATKGSSDNTIKAYQRDVQDYCALSHSHGRSGSAGLRGVYNTDVRAWMANERKQGVTSRTLARKLSAVKSFLDGLPANWNLIQRWSWPPNHPSFRQNSPALWPRMQPRKP